MMKLRKLLSAALSLALAASLSSPAFAAEEQNTAQKYGDTAGHWAEDAVDRWSGYGVVQGGPGGNFNPNQPITRGSLAKAIVNLLGLSEKAENTYSDLKGTEWYADAVLRCTAAGIMEGAAQRCNAEANITRQETTVMLARALGIKPDANPDLGKFDDRADVAGWAAGYVSAMAERGIITGTGNGAVAPLVNIDRASVMAILDKAVSTYANKPGTYEAKGGGITLVACGGVTVTGSAKDVLITAGAKGGEVKLDGATITGAVTVAAPDVKLSAPKGVVIKNESDGDITVNGKPVKPGESHKGESSGGGGGSSGGGSNAPAAGNYTYEEALSKFSDTGAQGTVKQYIRFLTDPSYGTGNDQAFTDLDLANTETFVNKDFTLHPSLFPSLRNVAASALTADRSTLWLAYTDGGMDKVDMRTGSSTHFAAEGLTSGKNLLLVLDEPNARVYLITENGVSAVKA